MEAAYLRDTPTWKDMNRETTTLPAAVCAEKERREQDEQIRASLRMAQAAYLALRELPDIGEVPEAHNCTEEWVDRIWSSKKEAVNHAELLLPEQKKKQISHWRSWLRDVHKYVRILGEYIHSVPPEQYVWDANLYTFYLRDIDELVKQRSTHVVPDEANKHWQLVQHVTEAIALLRDWEDANDVNRLPLEQLYYMSADTFAYAWATSSMKVNHSFDHLPGVAINRQYSRNMIKL